MAKLKAIKQDVLSPLTETVELTEQYKGYSSIVYGTSVIPFVNNKAIVHKNTAEQLRSLQIVK